MKVYFTQADVDAFRLRQNDLSEQVKRGDITFGYTVFKTFLVRVDERVALVDTLLKQPQDFTVDEEMTVDADATTYAKSDAEVGDKWRKRIKYDLLVLKVDKGKENPHGITGQEAIDKLTRRYHSFAKRMHQTDSDELAGDVSERASPRRSIRTPTTCRPSTLENFDIHDAAGAGRHRRLAASRGRLHGGQARSFPAAPPTRTAGCKVEDKIVGVGQGDEGEIVDVVDMKLNDVVKLIRGKRGTMVRLEVIPADGGGAEDHTTSPARRSS